MPKILRMLLVLTCAAAWSSWGDVVCVGTASSCTAAGGTTADPLTLVDITGTTSNCGGAAAAAANSVCLSANGIDAEGTTADAFEFRLAFGDSTAGQILTCTGAASSAGCVVASPAVPVNGTTAGNALAFTASPAIPNAGAGTDGAAAGGGITLTTGAAARDTSGNAAGGNITMTLGAGIGTGARGTLNFTTSGSVVQAAGGDVFAIFGASTNAISMGTNQVIFGTTVSSADVGISRSAANALMVTNSSTLPGAFHARRSVETVATTKAPGLLETGELYTNGADVDGQVITLPNDPTVGVCYEFALTATNSSNAFVIAPNTGETLSDAGTSCATVFSATAVGATCLICAVSGGSGAQWFVMSKTGTWTCTP